MSAKSAVFVRLDHSTQAQPEQTTNKVPPEREAGMMDAHEEEERRGGGGPELGPGHAATRAIVAPPRRGRGRGDDDDPEAASRLP